MIIAYIRSSQSYIALVSDLTRFYLPFAFTISYTEVVDTRKRS